MHHLLKQHRANFLLRLAQPNRHIAEQWLVSHVRGQAVPVDVAGPFELGCVGVPGADVAGLQLFELLLGAKFVRLWKSAGEYRLLESSLTMMN